MMRLLASTSSAVVLLCALQSSAIPAPTNAEIEAAREAYQALSDRNRLKMYEDCKLLNDADQPLEAICLVALKLDNQAKQVDENEREKLCPDKFPCACLQDGRTVSCQFGICGFEKGSYKSDYTAALAGEVLREYEVWKRHRIQNVRFVGFADDTPWLKRSRPKPFPVSSRTGSCVDSVLGTIDYQGFPDLSDSMKDKIIATLRGCQLRSLLVDSLSPMALEVLPTVDEKDRQRAASLSFLVLNACSEVRNAAD